VYAKGLSGQQYTHAQVDRAALSLTTTTTTATIALYQCCINNVFARTTTALCYRPAPSWVRQPSALLPVSHLRACRRPPVRRHHSRGQSMLLGNGKVKVCNLGNRNAGTLGRRECMLTHPPTPPSVVCSVFIFSSSSGHTVLRTLLQSRVQRRARVGRVHGCGHTQFHRHL
jgi:hypothetical protein